MAEYSVSVSKEQLALIAKALDFYTRIQLGQVSEITNPFVINLPDADYKNVETILKELKKAMFPNLEYKEYYSVKSKLISESVRQSIDIYEAIDIAIHDKDKTPIQLSNESTQIKIQKKE